MLTSLALVSLLAVSSSQQSAAGALVLPEMVAPTREYVAPTPEEFETLKTGVAHYQRREFDQALAVFRSVVAKNPESAPALYEVALTYYELKEYQAAIDTVGKVLAIRTPELARAYALIGNVLDHAGEPKRAVEVYRKGLEFVSVGAVSLHYNMAVTYAGTLNDLTAAKAAVKDAALSDPNHASSQLLLAKLFLRDSLSTPGLLATGRFLILEPASARIQEAYTLWNHVLAGNVKPNGEGGLTVSVNPSQPKTEGDLTKLDLQISLSRINAMALPDKTEIQRMVTQIDTLLGVYSTMEPGADAGTFLWTYYMPYFRELRAKGFVEPFVYFISQRTPYPGVREWLTANQPRVVEFVNWSRAYSWPTPRTK